MPVQAKGPLTLADLLSALPAGARVLDLGCGTGRFSQALAVYFDAEVIGVDPSIKMLERAREKQNGARVRYVEGKAEAIPVESASIDLIFMSMSFHHFADQRAAARECRRALRHGGSVFETAGFRLVSAEIVTQTIAPDWMTYAAKVAAGGDSVISRLSDAELEAGLAELRNFAAIVNEPVVEPIDVLDFQ